jgi:hypothetical protein
MPGEAQASTAPNPLDIPDEEFLKISSPEALENYKPEESSSNTEEDEAVASGNEGTGDEAKPDDEKSEGEAEGSKNQDPVESPDGQEGTEGDTVQSKTEEGTKEKGAEAPKPESDVPVTGSTEEPKPVDHKAFYEQIMAPFKANGKTIELKSPEEAIQLMQMGANYTRKMQSIQPHRKVLTMLENNNLLDENRLSYLIDLDKKNPEAIKKLIKDAGIDPLQIDTEVEPTYLEGSHKVSDAEVNFRSNLEDLSSTPTGKETLHTINSTWDETSKEVLWGEPSLMTIIHAQRETGVYDRISNEMDRQKMLGKIAPDTPFLKAYKEIGDELAKVGGFDDLLKPKQVAVEAPVSIPAGQSEPEPVATRVAKPKPSVENGDKASAASPTRSTPKPARPFINPLEMPDDQFMAEFAKFQGRV